MKADITLWAIQHSELLHSFPGLMFAGVAHYMFFAIDSPLLNTWLESSKHSDFFLPAFLQM
jgi:hypothetical protein